MGQLHWPWEDLWYGWDSERHERLKAERIERKRKAGRASLALQKDPYLYC